MASCAGRSSGHSSDRPEAARPGWPRCATVLPLAQGVVERLQAGTDVADVGCGQGHTLNLMARAFPASRFVGCDFSE